MATTIYNDRATIGLTVQIPVEVMDDLQEIATASKADIHDLIIDYVQEGIVQALPLVKRENFFSSVKGRLRRNNRPEDAIETFEEKFTF